MASKPIKSREKLTERFEFKISASMLADLRNAAIEHDFDVAELIRGGAEAAIKNLREFGTINPKSMAVVEDELLPATFRAPILTKAPCGPWDEALQGASSFTLSQDAADELELRDGDLFVRANGDSMEGAGIPDGALLAVRPLQNGKLPRNGEIALVQAFTEDGCAMGTIKRWTGGATPVLLDGHDKKIELPKGTERVEAVAIVVAMLTRV